MGQTTLPAPETKQSRTERCSSIHRKLCIEEIQSFLRLADAENVTSEPIQSEEADGLQPSRMSVQAPRHDKVWIRQVPGLTPPLGEPLKTRAG